MIGSIEVRRKPFFFEKKNQKTFVTLADTGETSTDQIHKSFFGSFFTKKERLPSVDFIKTNHAVKQHHGAPDGPWRAMMSFHVKLKGPSSVIPAEPAIITGRAVLPASSQCLWRQVQSASASCHFFG
jgi:hypothetical protein